MEHVGTGKAFTYEAFRRLTQTYCGEPTETFCLHLKIRSKVEIFRIWDSNKNEDTQTNRNTYTHVHTHTHTHTHSHANSFFAIVSRSKTKRHIVLSYFSFVFLVGEL